MRLLSGEKATEVPPSSSVSSSLPLCASHTLVASRLQVAMRLPSGEKATESTVSECPLRVSSSFPLCASHTLAVASSPPVTMRLLSGEKATDLTLSECSSLSVSSSTAIGEEAVVKVVSSGGCEPTGAGETVARREIQFPSNTACVCLYSA